MRWLRSIALWAVASLALGIGLMGVGAGFGIFLAWLVGSVGLSGAQAALVTMLIALVLAGTAGGLLFEAVRE